MRSRSRVHPMMLMAVGTLAFAGLCLAQGSQQRQPNPNDAARSIESSGTKTLEAPRKATDSIVLLETDRPAITNISAAAAQTSGSPSSEIASLRQEIKNKQKRLELLMHMFVADERPFLIDPSSTTADQDAVAKRRFEQDELHKKSAEIAELRAKLEELTASLQQSAAR
jgi:hypothetical protein